MRGALAILTFAGLLGATRGAQAADTSTDPYPGIRHVVRTLAGPPALRAHIMVVDVSSQEIRLKATAPDRRGLTTSAWATAAAVQVAVNGDVFDPTGYQPAGLAAGDGSAWPGTADDATSAVLTWSSANNRAAISPANEIVGALPSGVDHLVSGHPMVLEVGAVPGAFDCNDVQTPCARTPRTAVGLSEDASKLVIVVVEGWSAQSAGLTAAETGGLLKAFGADTGFLLDGGGSSALVIANQGGLASTPSDGVERPVANHLGIAYGALPVGGMIGFIRDGDIFDATKGIAGATVRLDDGQTQTTIATPLDQRGRYSFANLRPRLVCATASAPGFHTQTRCKQVLPNNMVFNSIAMIRDTVPIDAAVPRPDSALTLDGGRLPDGGGVTVDGSLRDGAITGDGGGGNPPGGACACRAGGRPRGGVTGPLVVVLSALLMLFTSSRSRAKRNV